MNLKRKPRPNNRYSRLNINGKRVREHRHVWEQANGPVPEGFELHHINFDRKDNRLENLQMLTPTEHRRLHYGCYKDSAGQWMKPCRKCRVHKLLEIEFRKHKGGPYYICRACHTESKKIWARKKYQERKKLALAEKS